ncbi:MAG TPA: hypothetical protein ENJ32_01765 [Crenotrichaceae bacterium]|nr:hypothetical protein [Crenotrichaceae bacterium]
MINQTELVSNTKWKNNRILSTASSQYKMYWLFAIFWNALVWAAIILGGENILKAFDENPVFYFFISFPFIGLFLVYQALRETLAWIKFGKTPLIMEPFPGQLGGVVSGYVDVPVLFDASNRVNVSLSCVHHYWERRQSESRKTSDVIWQDSMTVRPRTSAKGLRIHFTFNPPENLPESQQSSRDYHEWGAKIDIPLTGSDFVREFIIPVCQVSDQVITATARFARQAVEQFDQQVKIPDARIPLISLHQGRTRFQYPWFRSKGMGLGFIVFGIFFSVFVWFMLQGFADFLPVTSMVFFGYVELFAVTMILLGIYLLGNSMTVDVGTSNIKIRHNILGIQFGGEIETSNIADIVIDKSASAGDGQSTKLWYSLKVIHKDGLESTVADSLEGYSYAESIRQQMIDCFGHRWKPTAYSERNKTLKKFDLPRPVKSLGMIASLAMPLALVYDFREGFASLIQIFSSFL